MKNRWIWGLPLVVGLLAVTAPLAGAQPLRGLFNDDCIDETTGAVDARSVASIADVFAASTVDRSRDQTVRTDPDTVLLGIALANNRFRGVDFNTLRDVRVDDRLAIRGDQRVDYDREDALSALALGFRPRGFGSLDCVVDVQTDFVAETSASQDVRLDDDNVLLGIALGNNVGGRRDLTDVADFSTVEKSNVHFTRNVNIDREDTLVALLFGSRFR